MDHHLSDFLRRQGFTPEELDTLCQTKYNSSLESQVCEDFGLTEKQFSKINSHTLGYLFEIICACERSSVLGYPISLWEHVSPEIRDRIGLPSEDTGIDILDQGNLAYAGQCKFYRQTTSVTAHHVNQTCSAVDRVRVSSRDFDILKTIEFLVPPGVRINPTKRKYEFNRVDIGIDVVRKWLEIGFKTQLPETIPSEISLRECQRQCLDMYHTYPEKNWRFRLICGAGKTLIIANIVKSVQGRSCILVPSLILMDQIQDLLESLDISVSCCGTGRSPDKQTSVVVCVYNSFPVIEDWGWDQIVIDEAHHVNDRSESEDDKYLDRIWEATMEVPTVFMSATLDGEIDYSYSLLQGIEDGILTDYQVHIPVFSGKDYSQPLIGFLEEHPEMTSVLAYCNSVDSANEFCDLCNDFGIPADVIVGTDRKKKRQRILREFREAKFRVLVSVNVLGEGVDLPCANACIFVEPRSSIYSIIQIVGRTLRKHPGKELAHVILPGVDVDGDVDCPMIGFLRKLGQEDPRIFEMFRNRVLGHRVKFEILPREVKTEEDAEEVQQLYEEIYDRSFELISSQRWDFKLEVFRRFYLEHNRLPKKSEEYEGVKLGKWLSKQRTSMNGGKMSDERIISLDAVTPEWRPAENEKRVLRTWEETYEIFRTFYIEHTRLPKRSEEYEGVKLGDWLSNQRQFMKRGELLEEKIVALDTVTPEWRPAKIEKTTRRTWEETYEIFRTFYIEHNRLPKKSEEYEGVKLGGWLSRQRQTMNDGKMSEERIVALDTVTPEWRPAETEKRVLRMWEETCEIFRDFYLEHNQLPKRSEEYEGVKLGNWLSKQRASMNDGKMSDERIIALDAVTPGWRPAKTEKKVQRTWEETCEVFRRFYLEHNQLPKYSEEYEGVKLGKWLSKQRTSMNGGKMSDERIIALDAVTPGWRPAKTEKKVQRTWEEICEIFRTFYIKHSRPPTQKEGYEGVNLGVWLSSQRQNMKNGEMSEERIVSLDTVTPEWRPSKTGKFSSYNMNYLREFCKMIEVSTEGTRDVLIEKLIQADFDPPKNYSIPLPANTDYTKWKKYELQEKCKQLGVNIRGTTVVLVQRILDNEN